MKFGFIGAGNVAQTYAKHFVRHGHEVVLSNSKGPDSLAELVRSIGPNAKAGTVKEAAKQDIVILAVRWEQAEQALAEVSDWNGRILVDATNRPLEEDTKGKTASEVIASYAPGARIVKALNTLVANWIQDYSDKKPKLVLFLSGDDTDAKRKLARALEETGFVPVDLGGLIDGGKLQEFGAPLSGLHLDLIKRLEF
ncbi:NAD(P)-binding domain-containing protein [Sideroxydans sp. CL21]|uniref:NADPH-dependent F420 reductase n=1 Tax=Sideroxydans sp. CL21 TaxID=2600596 RepID=UPI0024BCE5AE|nr:NAD(P)-binding domain-containing protein [Sideroxydans sp. CL21]